MLQINSLNAYYGQRQVLHSLSLTIKPKQIVTVIGSNGAGKTTLIHSIAGLVHTKGEIIFQQYPMQDLPTEQRINRGLAIVPEGRGIFANLTVKDNLHLGGWQIKKNQLMKQKIEQIFNFFPNLAKRAQQYAINLSGGEQQMLAIARALMSEPSILLLDEVSMGLAPIIVESLFQKLQQLNQEGTAILLIEQNAVMALSLAHYGYVLEQGSIALQGEAKEINNNEKVKQIYLGHPYS